MSVIITIVIVLIFDLIVQNVLSITRVGTETRDVYAYNMIIFTSTSEVNGSLENFTRYSKHKLLRCFRRNRIQAHVKTRPGTRILWARIIGERVKDAAALKFDENEREKGTIIIISLEFELNPDQWSEGGKKLKSCNNTRQTYYVL